MIRRLSAAWLFCVLLSGCGGGGGSSLPQTQPIAPGAASKQNVRVSIAIPAAKILAAAAKRNPKYVSINTQSAAISVNGATPVIANLSAASQSCVAGADGGRVCTVAVSAPVGTDTFAETLYASTDGSGPILSQNNTSFPITAGVANTVSMTLAGVVATISVTLTNPSPPIGAASSTALTVTASDASQAAIIGDYPFANSIFLTDSDTTGATSILSSAGAPIARLNSPADAAGLTVAYTGAAIASATFTAATTDVPPISGAATLTPSTSAPTPTPPPAATAFVDWPTYGFDSQRSGFNPNTTAITPASISGLHLGWQISTAAGQTQPIVATNVGGHKALLIIGSYNVVQARDALTGALVWQTALPKQDVQACGTSGVSGTVVYDKTLGAVFAVAGNGGGAPNHILLYRLDIGSGTVQTQVDVTPTLQPGEANDSHAGVAFANGQVYVGTGSDCEGDATIAFPSWRGRVVAVNPSTMAINNTFFTTWGQGTPAANYGGGGVWAWGGVTADASGNIYVATGNAETNLTTGAGKITAPFQATDDEQAGYAEHIVKLSSDLSTVLGSNYPGFNFTIGFEDLDFTGSPVVFSGGPSNCGVLSATQGKGGTLVIHNTADMSVVNQFALSVPSAEAFYMGNPAYSPVTGYVYAAITASGAGSSLLPPGLAAIGGCGTTMPWHATFGPDSTTYARGSNPRSAPSVTAGGVVFIGTVCTPTATGGCGAPGTANGAIWAVDASAGTVLGSGNPVLHTGSGIRVPPTVDGQWVYVYDTGGNLYGLTIDSTVPAITPKAARRAQPTFLYKGEN